MTRSSSSTSFLRGLAFAMLATSMLLLQPLASSAWCMATGMDCCAADSEVEEPPAPSCCGEADSGAEHAGGEEAPAEPCCCGIDDGPISDLPPVVSDSVAAAAWAGTLEGALVGTAGLERACRQPAYRARAPGRLRSARVLYQVFRL